VNNKSRITSILKTYCLDTSITGLPTFDLLVLELDTELDFELPTNLRLGHLAEAVVSKLIKASTNYKVLHENVQLIEEKKTIGEIDFIISHKVTNQVTHMELAYKFYLYDSTISDNEINNWIGPNRNDSLTEKLRKVRDRQFPLLHHNLVKTMLDDTETKDIEQKLCLLVSLFVPYKFSEKKFDPVFQNSIKGYYLTFEEFINSNHSQKEYHLPTKLEWGIDPSQNGNWTDFNGIEKCVTKSIHAKKAPLCWQKNGDAYVAFFIVWW